VDVFIMTDHANNDVIVFGRDNRDFITVFILLVVFVLGATIILPKKALKRDNRYQRDKKRNKQAMCGKFALQFSDEFVFHIFFINLKKPKTITLLLAWSVMIKTSTILKP
jgi:hypothetical protein